MEKRLKTLPRRLSAIAIAAVMCMATALPAFAGDPVFGTETAPAQAGITKKLTMPEGTTTPDATFTFQVEKVSIDDSTDAGDLVIMPGIGPITIPFTAADTGSVTGGIKTVIRQSGDILSNVTFPHAGVYKYRITENSTPGYTIGTNEAYTYSPAEYELTVYVKNGENGLYIGAVASTITTADGADQTVTGNGKVDPTPHPGDPNLTGNYSQTIFTNTYSKTAGGVDPTDPDNHVLAISKTVIGDYGDRSKYFPFTVKAIQPGTGSGINGTVTYKGYVVDSNNQVVTSTDNFPTLNTDSAGYSYIEFPSAADLTVNLKHGQKLVFTNLHIGAAYDTEEHAVPNYTASASVIVNGGTATETSNSGHNQLLHVGTHLIGENQNSAAFSNTYLQITPTGVVINSLPFVLILILAAGAFVAFVISKSRKKRNYVSSR